MATDDVQRLVTGTASTPATFTVPGNGQIRPKAIFAHFDGTGAAGSFQPALKITSDAGKLVGIYATDTTVVAGASADTSWFPHLAAAATGGSGIQYDTDNEGDWLYVGTTSGGGGPLGRPLVLNDEEGGGVILQSGGDGLLNPGAKLDVSDSGVEIQTFKPDDDNIDWQIGPSGVNLTGTLSSPFLIDVAGGQNLQLLAEAAAVQIQTSNVGTKLAFFGVAAVGQQATPVTLGDVIALLRAYGLSA